ncbi:hypothetical protein TIFTF001_023746 [Ficus carica]|uniref:Uncharacterized protein n=1 Tax=Ficus carica TaxID=3494 RepID=A0AA88ALI7_FICCA|nr:hypothetical protein TIFTF001_023746 [Ficus carica]
MTKFLIFSSQSIWGRSWKCRSGLRGNGIVLMSTAFDDIDYLLEIYLVVSENFNCHNSGVGEEHEGGDLVTTMKMVALMVGEKCQIFETIQ